MRYVTPQAPWPHKLLSTVLDVHANLVISRASLSFGEVQSVLLWLFKMLAINVDEQKYNVPCLQITVKGFLSVIGHG